MIRVLAAPTEIVLYSGSYARTYRLLREIDADDVSVNAHVNHLSADSSAFPSNVSVRSHDKPNRLFYFASLYRELYDTVRSENVDVYQHANLGFREFNPAVLLPPDSDTPFLIGPAEGGHAVPSAEFKRVLARQIDRNIPAVLETFAARAAEPVVRNGLDPVRERLFGVTLERADRIVAVHSDAKECFEQYTDTEKIDVIPYGVDMQKFPFQAGPGNQSFVTVGNLIERKGHRYLLDAMTMVTEEFPDIELHIVGTGPLREDLETQVATAGLEDSVIFHGFVEDEKLLRLLHRARAFVHSSLSEGFSHVRLEAMSAGCPVIGTDVSGARDLTRHGTDGYIVPSRDADALADSMVELLADDKLAEEMGWNAREKVEKDHDYAEIAQRYLDIYREMANT
ncbi:glycosyltransferase family 4 protein [Haloterrigena salifodinae]|uniref:glycosyltransferase family 4 protein n=1 Tax=Haloterrigena salifodinae TaxID=2675099 RepID=UPI000F87618D|nr:glycosyltransferase family 4 protein [Haloterrigena salifodinae]